MNDDERLANGSKTIPEDEYTRILYGRELFRACCIFMDMLRAKDAEIERLAKIINKHEAPK